MTLRLLLITNVVLTLASIVVEFLPDLIPEVLTAQYDKWMETLEPGSLFPALVLALCSFIAWIIAAVGMYMYQSWARPVGIVSVILVIVAISLWGPMLDSPLSWGINYLNALTWGGAIALSYSLEYREKFTRVKAN